MHQIWFWLWQVSHHCVICDMSIIGVSCDSCMKSGFTGMRYKCLVCCDYDLCSACYEAKLVTSRHKVDHAMQCLLTKSDVGQSRCLPLLLAMTVNTGMAPQAIHQSDCYCFLIFYHLLWKTKLFFTIWWTPVILLSVLTAELDWSYHCSATVQKT